MLTNTDIDTVGPSVRFIVSCNNFLSVVHAKRSTVGVTSDKDMFLTVYNMKRWRHRFIAMSSPIWFLIPTTLHPTVFGVFL